MPGGDATEVEERDYMESVQQKACRLHSDLLRAGFRSCYDEDRALLFSDMSHLEVTLGIPNVLPPGAEGDVLIQFSPEAGKLSSDVIRVPEARIVEMIVACNGINAQSLYTRFYVHIEDLVVVAERDFAHFDETYCERIIAYLPRFKQDVTDAYPVLKRACESGSWFSFCGA